VNFAGEVANKNVPSFLAVNHIFALPTSGENFGHAIFEALAHGKPVLVSDQTPWRGLEPKTAGWDLPLDQPAAFENAIRQAVGFNDQEMTQWSRGAWQFVHDHVQQNNLKEAYQRLFN
jgi:glycosyltransferase involved in cell wall biosynthesis